MERCCQGSLELLLHSFVTAAWQTDLIDVPLRVFGDDVLSAYLFHFSRCAVKGVQLFLIVDSCWVVDLLLS